MTNIVTKSLAMMEDLEVGINKVTQVRNQIAVTGNRVFIPVPVDSDLALSNIDVSKYTYAVKVVNNIAAEYTYDPTGTKPGIQSVTGPGTWFMSGVSALSSSADGDGDALVAVKQPFAHAKVQTQHDKNTLTVNIKDFEGVTGNGTTLDTAGINNAILDVFNAGGGVIDFPPGTYLINSPIIPRRGVLCKAAPGSVTIKLANGANTGLVESYKFDTLKANSAHSIADDSDFTQDYGFDGFIFDGNSVNQSTSTLVYGVKMYGLRLTLKRCIIYNIAGVGLWTAHAGAGNGAYTISNASIPACIDELEIINSFDENWIYEGPSDTPIGSVVTNENGDKNNPGIVPQTSRHFPGEPVHSVVVAANKAMQADYLNLNSPRFGKCFVVKDNTRLTIDTLITAGGWGNVEFGVNCNGVVKNNFSQANKINWGGVTKPFVLNYSNKLVITDTIIRRASGQDVGADGVFDAGGANWGTVANLQAATQGGHLFVADATGIMIGQLKPVGIGGLGSDGLVSAALVTTENSDQINCTLTFSNVTLAWRNKKNGLIGNIIATGDVGAGNNFAEGLTGTPGLNKSSLMTMQAVFKDGTGAVKTNNFIGVGAIDLTSTGGKTVAIAHTLWRAPSIEEIQGTLRHSSFTAAGAFSPVYVNSFNASQVVFRIDVTTAATGTPVSQVVCRIN